MPSWGVQRTISPLNPCDPVPEDIPTLPVPLERFQTVRGDDHPLLAVVFCVEDFHCCCE